MLSYFLFGIAIVGTLGSTVFLVLALIAAWQHQHSRHADAYSHLELPPVSVLKPVHGNEPNLRQNLESFFLQDYPVYELVFCARTRDDEALVVVDELCHRYPNVKVQILACGEPPFANAKVHSLMTMISAARNNVLMLADSDVFAACNCVREVCQPLADPKVGVVTSLYRGVGLDTIWSRLEALGFSVEMPSGALIAKMLEGMRFALGPMMATRKDVLEKIGGMAQFGNYCAEDFLIGNKAADAGFTVILSHFVAEHLAVDRTFMQSFSHQVRWMRSTRFSRPKGHLGTGITFAMPFGILALIAGFGIGHPAMGAAFFFWAYLNRVFQSVAIGYGVVGDRYAYTHAWLYPLRDLLGFFVWIGSYASDQVIWRGQRYRILSAGKMEKATAV